MKTSHSLSTRSKAGKPLEAKGPLVPPANAAREKAKLKQGRERLEDEASIADTSARTSVMGDRLNTP